MIPPPPRSRRCGRLRAGAFALVLSAAGCASGPVLGPVSPLEPLARDLGLRALEAARPEEALAHFREALAADPRDLPSAIRVAGILESGGRKDERAAFLAAADPAPGGGPLRGTLASWFSGSGTDSEMALRAAVREDPDFAGAHHQLGVLARDRGDAEEAARAFAEAARARPDWAESHLLLGRTLIELRRASDAVKPLLAWHRRHPDDAETAYNLGRLLLSEFQDHERALPVLEAALAGLPRDVGVLIALGAATLLAGRVDLAEAHFLAAAEADDADPDPHYNLGVLYAEHLRDPVRAVTAFQEYLKRGGPDVIRVRTWIEELSGGAGAPESRGA